MYILFSTYNQKKNKKEYASTYKNPEIYTQLILKQIEKIIIQLIRSVRSQPPPPHSFEKPIAYEI